MAKPMFSGIGVVDLQNSIRNTTFSRNAYGTYSKNKIGAPASTSYLLAWQSIVSSLRFDWVNIMADADRLTWYKFYVPRKQNMADKVFLNGFDAYLSVNLNRAICSQPPLYTAPSTYNAPRIDNTAYFSAINTVNLEVTYRYTNQFYLAIYVTPQLSAGRMSLNQIFSLMVVGSPFSTSYNFPLDYTARFGALTVGKKIFGRVCVIDANIGCRSDFHYFVGTIS